MAIGAVLLVAAYLGAEGRNSFSAQVAWLNLAVLGATTAAAGQALLLIRGRRTLGLQRRTIMGGVASEVERLGGTPPPSAPVSGLVVVPGGTRRHREDCLLVRGKDAQAVPRGRIYADCEVCIP